MHELSIALSIIEMAEEQLARHGGSKVLAVHLRVGPLSGISKDALEFSFGIASESTPVAGSQLRFEDSAGQDLEVVALEIE